MDRRDVLLTLAYGGVASAAPLANALAAWKQAATATNTPLTIGAERARLIAKIADAIIPRTDTPGATDVGVPQWIDVMLTEYYSDQERQQFLTGLDAIDALANTLGGAPFASLADSARSQVMAALERDLASGAVPTSTYAQLKRLVVDGYFTSEIVQKHILETEVIPGRFDGCAPLPLAVERSRA